MTTGGHPTAQVAWELGLTPNLLRRWKQEVAGDPAAAFPGKGRRKPHEEELAQLKRDLARVTQERDFFLKVWRRTSPSRSHEVPGHSCAYRPLPRTADVSHPGGVTIGLLCLGGAARKSPHGRKATAGRRDPGEPRGWVKGGTSNLGLAVSTGV